MLNLKPTSSSRTARCRFAVIAVSVVTLALTLLPLAAPAHADALGDGKKAFEKGDVNTALQFFQKAVADNPDRADAFRWLGTAQESRRKWSESLAAFDRAAELEPRSSDAQRGRAAALEALDREEESVAAYRQAMDLNHKYPEAALGLGALLVELERYDESVEVLTRGLKWGKDWVPVFHQALGKAEAARGNLKEAEVHLLRARELAPNQARFHRALGDLYLDRGIASLAIVSYQQGIDIEPHDLPSRFAMARALAKESRYNEALDQYKEIIAIDSSFALAYKEMGDLYLRASGRSPAFLANATSNLERYHKLTPDDEEGTILLARAYYKAKRRDEAGDLLEPLAAADMLDEQGHAVYGRILYTNRVFPGAADELLKGGKFLQDTDLRRLAHALKKSERFPEVDSLYAARWEADSTAEVPLEKASSWILERGKLHFQLGKEDSMEYAIAIPMLEKKIELDPAADDAFYYLGLSYREQERFEEALEPLEKAAELAPDKGPRHFWLAVTHVKLDSVALAITSFEAIAALDDSTVLGAIARQRLGYYRLLEKDYVGAIEYLLRSTEINPKQVQSWVWLGQAYQNSGQRAKAQDAYRKALELNPNQADAKKGLLQLQE